MVKKDPRAIPKDHEVISHFIDLLKALIGRIAGRNRIDQGKVLWVNHK